MKKLNRKDLPFVMRMPITVNLLDLVETIHKLSTTSESLRLKYDTESAYKIDDGTGNNFVYTAEGYNLYPSSTSPSDYNVASLHSMEDRAINWMKTHTDSVKSNNPLSRLRGMNSPYSSPYWDPTFDERVYSKRTELCDETLSRFLDSFKYKTFRSSVAKFEPKMFLSPHIDIGPEFVVRTQTPVITNNHCVMGFRKHPSESWKVYRLEAGYTYFVNSGWEHYARNDGNSTRYQIRVCLEDQAIFDQMSEVSPIGECNDWEKAW